MCVYCWPDGVALFEDLAGEVSTEALAVFGLKFHSAPIAATEAAKNVASLQPRYLMRHDRSSGSFSRAAPDPVPAVKAAKARRGGEGAAPEPGPGDTSTKSLSEKRTWRFQSSKLSPLLKSRTPKLLQVSVLYPSVAVEQISGQPRQVAGCVVNDNTVCITITAENLSCVLAPVDLEFLLNSSRPLGAVTDNVAAVCIAALGVVPGFECTDEPPRKRPAVGDADVPMPAPVPPPGSVATRTTRSYRGKRK